MSTEIDYIKIGLKIQKERIYQNMKQRELAEKIGVGEKYVSSLENGANISLATLVKIANILKLSLDYLLSDELKHYEAQNSLSEKITTMNQRGKEYLLKQIHIYDEYFKE